MAVEGRRAHSLKELREIQDKIFGNATGPKTEPLTIRATDVVVTPFGKSGTTWLQQMVHTLRTGGDMDFDDISRVIPWIEMNPMLHLDLNAEQRANPRAFKSHNTYEDLPKGGKYINSLRDPRDALYSNYKFMEGWFVEPGTIDLEDFALNSYIASGRYWAHLISWWKVRHQSDVLFLSYELMQKDTPATIRRVAEFIGVPLTDELLDKTLEYTSIDFMKAHKDRFDDAMMRALSEADGLLPAGSDSAKVREGRVGDHKENLSPKTLEALEEVWQKEVKPVTGFDSYEALLAQLEKELS